MNSTAYIGNVWKGWWVGAWASISSFYIMGDPYLMPTNYNAWTIQIVTFMVWVANILYSPFALIFFASIAPVSVPVALITLGLVLLSPGPYFCSAIFINC